MSRSFWKLKLFKKNVFKKIYKTNLRAITLLNIANVKNKILMIYNGQNYLSINFNSSMIGSKIGEFSLTKRTVTHAKYKKRTKKKK
jgi:ribosomal protein S19